MSGETGPSGADSEHLPEPSEQAQPRALAEPHEPRPLLERIGLAAVALVLALLFGGVAAASWVGGELFLAAMGAIACLMTVWVGAVSLFRG